MLAFLAPLDYVVITAYILSVLAVGVWFGRGRQNTESFLLGGRSILWWVAGISYLMTLLSTVSMVGLPGEAYNHGITLSIQNIILPFIAFGAFHLFVPFYFKAKMYTPFHYLERRFDSRVRALSAAFYWAERLICGIL